MAIAALWSSDLSRARGTALAVAERHPGLDVRLDPDLREIDLGRWEGVHPDVLRRDWPDLYSAWRHQPSWDLVPGGEGSQAFKLRVLNSFERIAAATDDDQTVAVVTHIGVIRTLLSVIVGASTDDLRWPWAIDNTGLTTLLGPADFSLWTTAALEVTAVNDSAHLGLRSTAESTV